MATTPSTDATVFNSTFGYEGTASAETIGLTTNFAPVVNQPGTWMARNNGSILNQNEVVALKAEDIKSVSNNLKLPENTIILRQGIQYVVKIEEDLRTVSSTDPSFQQDDPVVMYVVVRHPNSAFVNGAIIDKMFARLQQVIKKPDGKTRWDDLMRLSTQPNS